MSKFIFERTVDGDGHAWITGFLTEGKISVGDRLASVAGSSIILEIMQYKRRPQFIEAGVSAGIRVEDICSLGVLSSRDELTC